MNVVVIHHVQERLESPVMKVPSLVRWIHEETILTHKEAGQIHRLVDVVRSAISLETIDAHLGGCVQIPTRICPQWLHMTLVAPCLTAKQFIAPCSRRDVKVNAGFGRRSRNRELIEMQRRQLLCYAIVIRRNVRQIGKTIRGSDRKLRGIVQARIKEPTDTAHLQRCDKRIPVTNSSPRSRPRMLIEARETKSVRDQSRSRNVGSRDHAISHLLRIERFAVE